MVWDVFPFPRSYLSPADDRSFVRGRKRRSPVWLPPLKAFRPRVLSVAPTPMEMEKLSRQIEPDAYSTSQRRHAPIFLYFWYTERVRGKMAFIFYVPR